MIFTTETASSQPEPGDSTAHSTQCIVCSSRVAIYTCPRCATRTCSLPCSVSHKTSTACSGVRDKAKFVPMNRYTHGTMMDDYVLLENVSRRVSEWGRDIARGGYANGVRGRGQLGRGRGGRGGGMGRGNRTTTTTTTREGVSGKKRDTLRSQLESRDVEVDLLPAGMRRRKLNRSVWDPKKRSAFLTIEYIIHPPVTTVDANTNDVQKPYTLLTHHNEFDLPLRDLFQSQTLQRTKGKGKTRADLPSWVKAVALPHPDIPDAFTPPQFFMRAPLGLLSAGQSVKFGFIKLDGERKLSALLRNKQIVEFPTVEVWEEGAFRGLLLDDAGAIDLRGAQRPAKKRKLDVTKGRVAIAGLLGGYGSEEDEEVEEVDTVLTRLGDYEESDVEDEQPTTSDEADTDGLEGDDDDEEGELDAAVDPVTLLAMVQEAQRQHEEDGDGEYDEVDWGESDDDS